MSKGHLETEEGREAARGLGDQGERAGCRAMESHGGCMNGGGGWLWCNSGFSADSVAAVGRSPLGAGGQDSVQWERVGALIVETGQRQACAHSSDSL